MNIHTQAQDEWQSLKAQRTFYIDIKENFGKHLAETDAKIRAATAELSTLLERHAEATAKIGEFDRLLLALERTFQVSPQPVQVPEAVQRVPTQETPELIRVSRVVRYMQKMHGLDVTRQTVYNWINCGVRGVKLRSQIMPCTQSAYSFNPPKRGHYLTTTTAWVDEFLAALSQHSNL
jgi:hypothetical protein